MARKRTFTAAEVSRMLLESDCDDDGDESDEEEDDSDSDSSFVAEADAATETESESDMDISENVTAQSSVTSRSTQGTLSNLQWTDDPRDVPVLPAFTGKTGALLNTDNMSPLDYFMTYFDMDLIRHLVYQTNLYANQYLRANDHKLGPRSRARSWKDTNAGELMQFIGITLLMGIVKKPTIASYCVVQETSYPLTTACHAQRSCCV